MTTGFEPEAVARLRGMGLTDEEIKWLVENYRGDSWLEQQLRSYIAGGRISKEQAATIFDLVLHNVPIRERQISAWEEEREAEAQAKAREREARETHLSQVWEEFQRDPVVAPYLKDIRQSEIESYLSGQSDELLPKLSSMWTEAYEAQRAQTKEARETQRTEAFFAGMEALGKPAPKEEFVRPAMPGTEKITKAFLEETGLAKGTKLRSFLAGEIIPEVLEETRRGRAAWWKRMHPEPVYEEDYAGAKASLQEQARRWAGKAWGPRAASEEEVSGGSYWGPGGLRARAERAYRHALQSLGELKPEDFPEYEPPPKPGKDPLIGALGKKKFRPEYYRRPGAGLVRALTPAIRY